MNWKEYEKIVEAHFRTEYPSARIVANAKQPGKLSKTERQIDLLIEQQICDSTFRIIVDAKCRHEKIDVKGVEEFLGLTRDVGAHKGIMISTEGYTNAAIQRAAADDADMILDVLNFKELKEYQGPCAIAYQGPHGAVLDAPLGWIIDGTKRRGSPAWLYERGLTFDEATKLGEFMYVNFWGKKAPVDNLESLFRYQEEYMGRGTPISHVEFIEAAQRANAKTAIRVVKFQKYPQIGEYTGFVDFPSFIFMCVLFAPDELAQKNLAKLRFVIRKVFPLSVTYGDSATPEKLKPEIQSKSA